MVSGQNGTNWIITSGLKDGDKVAIDGTMIAGLLGAQKVQIQEWQASSPQLSGSTAAPAQISGAASATQPASEAK